ncbi:hypothetical protein [Bailinhaonella thermotolerans]|uniref:RING-type domain-containing protein n=1 Tax=Bailinhaonella thermotolerans TaxID=1070861 RepID=A0A3A4ALA1_9ACTN|nr:hypothetical protein [Bailinhaonella thermotolerans]RJL30426.1 hypothetical protein D5H75_22925 [Bailinhaonella thermotolerans]
MSCDHLICARCAGPVMEGRCPACRAAREELHGQGMLSASPLLIAIAVLLVLMLALAVHLHA